MEDCWGDGINKNHIFNTRSVWSSGENVLDEEFCVEGFCILKFEFLEEFVELIFWEFFAQVGHDISELFHRYSISSWFEYGVHCVYKLVLRLGLFVFPSLTHNYILIKSRNLFKLNFPVRYGSTRCAHSFSYKFDGVWYKDLTNRDSSLIIVCLTEVSTLPSQSLSQSLKASSN